MAQIDLGKIKFNWRGQWIVGTAYETDDVVYDAGSSYIYVADVPVTNNLRPAADARAEVMVTGTNWRGPWTPATTYKTGDIVSYQDGVFICLIDNTVGIAPDSGAANWASLVPAPEGNVMSEVGDMIYRNNLNINSRLPIGEPGSILVALPGGVSTFNRGANYTIGTGPSATAILIDIDNSNNTVGNNNENAKITCTRGETYLFHFPDNQRVYSLKDPADPTYSLNGSGGRLLAPQVNPETATGAAALITFTPGPTTPDTVLIRDENGNTDQVEITVVDAQLVPSWRGNSFTNINRGARLPNDQHNFEFQDFSTIPAWCTFGRGHAGPNRTTGYRQAGFISEAGVVRCWGNVNNDPSAILVNQWAIGSNISIDTRDVHESIIKVPSFLLRAFNGDASEAQWLESPTGQNLGYNSRTTQPRVASVMPGNYSCFFILDNGLLFGAGRCNNYSVCGDGVLTNRAYAFIVPFLDHTNSELTGVNRPRIKQVTGDSSKDSYSTTATHAALSYDGHVYMWGANTYGQLGQGNTTVLNRATRINPVHFDNEPVRFITSSGNIYFSMYAITASGRCYAWGYNAYGQLGINNTAVANLPVEITGVLGSPLAGRRIVHVMTAQGDSTFAKTWFLTDDGEVFFCGYNEGFGGYTGVEITTSVLATPMPIRLSLSDATINSDNQKVISMYTTGGRYSTQYFVTDGGDSNQPKVYSCGNNSDGQKASGTSVTNTGSATVRSNWLLSECEWIEYGSIELNPTGVGASDLVQGTQYTTEIQDRLRVGRIVQIVGHGYASGTDQFTLALDEHGRVYFCGEGGTVNPMGYHNAITLSQNTNDRWVPCYTQPEPFVDICLTGLGAAAEKGWMAIGESGNVYVGGSNMGTYLTQSESNVFGWKKIKDR